MADIAPAEEIGHNTAGLSSIELPVREVVSNDVIMLADRAITQRRLPEGVAQSVSAWDSTQVGSGGSLAVGPVCPDPLSPALTCCFVSGALD